MTLLERLQANPTTKTGSRSLGRPNRLNELYMLPLAYFDYVAGTSFLVPAMFYRVLSFHQYSLYN